eukprot:TRINITY_DN29833_c0_g1_i1.p1 TRINITY_DN29833_c0_g1~~TRINITY_DN29833_c0_g1_i1.p1  ORF type:complete len:352 (+),score=31.53 TRINITY_DN29833_c0_g1_i1:73-1056(+)
MYVDLNVLKLKNCSNDDLFVNQNLRGTQEFVAVPRVHVGEFRQLTPEQATKFWVACSSFISHLLSCGATRTRIEVSYGNWIVHKPGSANYHAHVHIIMDNYAVTVSNLLRTRGALMTAPNQKKKPVYEEQDAEMDITDLVQHQFSSTLGVTHFLQTSNGEALAGLFKAVYDWFPGLNGVLKITLENKEGAVGTRYWIRTPGSSQAQVGSQLSKLRDDLLAGFPVLPPGWGHGTSSKFGNFYFFKWTPDGKAGPPQWKHPVTTREYKPTESNEKGKQAEGQVAPVAMGTSSSSGSTAKNNDGKREGTDSSGAGGAPAPKKVKTEAEAT